MPETTPVTLLGPVGLALTGLFTLATALCLAQVLWHDLKRFEIDFAALGAAALAMLSLIMMLDGAMGALDALAMGALFGCVAEALRRVPTGTAGLPGAMGAGDPPLFAALGLAAGSAFASALLLFTALLSFLVALSWARARRRPLRRAMFPAALALVPAMGIALILRGLDAADTLPEGMDRLALALDPRGALALLALSGVFCLGLWLGARGPRRPGRDASQGTAS